MTDTKIVSKFVQAVTDAIPLMHRMLYIDRSITDINVKDRTHGRTALHWQAYYGTTWSVAWLLRQDPPPDVNVLDSDQCTPLIHAACTDNPEGKVRLLLDHGADRDLKSKKGHTALYWARWHNKKPAAVIDMLENYRPDVSR